MGAIENIKREARRLKKQEGMSHMAALEKLSRERGYTGWNAFLAAHPAPEANFNNTKFNF